MTNSRTETDIPISPIDQDETEQETQLQALIDRLAAEVCEPCPRQNSAPIRSLLDNLEQTLAGYHEHFQKTTIQELTLSYASEWVLDNYYILRQAVGQIREDLTVHYIDSLPKLNRPPYVGFPRISLVARSFLAVENLQVNMGHLELFFQQMQERIPLTMGELWAVPIFLRLSLVDALVNALEELTQNRQPERIKSEFDLNMNAEEVVAATVTSLRSVSNIDWKSFFETVSEVNRILRLDPAGVYPAMDFKTRDLYRKAVEELSLAAALPQIDIAQAALEISKEAAHLPPDTSQPRLESDRRAVHIGYYLIDKGRAALEARIGYHPEAPVRIRRWVKSHRLAFYLGGIFSSAALLMGIPTIYLVNLQASTWQIALAWLVFIFPVFTLGTGFINWLATLLISPSVLPKLELKEEIPLQWNTLITVPALLANPEEVAHLTRQLELHYLRNPQRGLHFALVSDFADADEETAQADTPLLDLVIQSIDQLNGLYTQPDGDTPFYLFHRRRIWNPSEGKWMGWERKRGKLHELNQLLRGASDLSFSHIHGDLQRLGHVQYILTLDADTILPIGAVSRLIGAMAHPLNRPVFAPGSSRVTAGYTIMQPRVEINPENANRSLFTRIYSGDMGLDLYSLAVSDVYQDLFGEGIYVGKGIYDLDGFERSISNRIPPNSLLSHDLFEGLLGRAALVTDITLVEGYPPNYFVHDRRQHRWIRGDWQLLPWLLGAGARALPLSLLDRWKLLDNLRRSMVAPGLMLFFVAGWLLLPGHPAVWTAMAFLSFSSAVIINMIMGILQLVSKEPVRSTLRSTRLDFLRWLLAVVFLPFDMIRAVDAAGVTLYRLYISKHNLLQWTTVAHSEAEIKQSNSALFAYREMIASLLFVLAIAALVLVLNPSALWAAMPLILLWIISPQIAFWISHPTTKKRDILTEAQIQQLRVYARQTWSFFEAFVGPEDHWLPPDHYQESPLGLVAHRTSPTNMGLLLTSTLAAYELGFIDQFNLVSRLDATFETLGSLERYRGHFLNWIDTRTLQPLNPRYVSSVDSGNLAACLIVTAETLYAMKREARVFRWQRWQGYLDTLAMFDRTLAELRSPAADGAVGSLRGIITGVQKQVKAARHRPESWYQLFQEVSGPVVERMTQQIARLVASEDEPVDIPLLRHIRQVAQQIDRQLKGLQMTIQELVPWIPLLESPTILLEEPEFATIFERLRASLPYSPVIGEIGKHAETGRQIICELENVLGSRSIDGRGVEETSAWLIKLAGELERAADNIDGLLERYDCIANQALRYVEEMDFRFLYHQRRRVFHIGFNLDNQRLDDNFYDLLASEARITSLIAIAKNDVPQEHWLYLNRPVTLAGGHHVLLSWSATMFEYLMPPLFFRTHEGTLLQESLEGAIYAQMEYARKKNVPWGISESGFYQFDNNQNYQYRAFGVPGLGFKRGLADDLVIAPYASFMAVGQQPLAVLHNAERMQNYGMLGLYGFYESIDFTENRLRYGTEFGPVCSYMSHHHGMILLALLNYLDNNIMVERMHANSQIKSVELLLQEQIPYSAPLQNPESEDVKGTQRLVPPPVEIQPWLVPIHTTIPQVHLLSNGTFQSLISNSGSGFLRWQEVDLTRWQPDGVMDNAGIWIYIKDLDREGKGSQVWSAAQEPTPDVSSENLVTFHTHMAVFKRNVDGLTASMEVTVPVDDPVEIRRLHIGNATDRPRKVQLTSYGEVILTGQANDARHPAFNKLFIQSEYNPELQLLIFQRRARSNKEKPVFLGHMLVVEAAAEAVPEEVGSATWYETDRAKFLGRWMDVRNPAGLDAPDQRSGVTGATLDPVFSLGQEIVIPPHGITRLAWLTFAAGSREEILALANRYCSWSFLNQAYRQAHVASETLLRKNEISGDMLGQYLQVLSALLYPHPSHRADPAVISANRLGQSGLWPFGISGDYPILLVEIDDVNELDLVRQALQAHRYYREMGIHIDLVVLNTQQTNYGAEMNQLLYRLIARMGSDIWLNQRGGVFVLYADQMNHPERVLLRTAARVILIGKNGSLKAHLPGYTISVPHLPAFQASRRISAGKKGNAAVPMREELLFHNGYGGFSADGREYVIQISPGKKPPLPWSNVIGYPEFGFLVTESGSSTTWAVNSGENRLTPWGNDPISDPTGEALYLRDEETGQVWTPTPKPAGGDGFFSVRHGAGYTQFDHHSHMLDQRLILSADPSDPVKIIRLRVKNTSTRPRRLTATQYVEWVLGTQRSATNQYLIPEYDSEREALLVLNPYSMEFNQRVAFLAASKKIHGMTADRMEFLGRNGTMQFPLALQRIGLEGRVTPGDHPCAVLQLHIDLPPGGEEEISFFLGQAADRQQALALVEKYHTADEIGRSWQSVTDFWDKKLGAVRVKTPDKAMDLLLNRWFLYQALSCRIWGRSAFYQSSGAFGFRDQLQDVMSVLLMAPEVARDHILKAASHQFEEGDVLHWWHPPSGRGVRTRMSDDLLWLPYVVAEYVQSTGDTNVLREERPFLHAPALGQDEEERYGEYPATEQKYSILEHCRRAIERASTSGPHRLPLMGTGDWNDGMNRVGVEGQGESVWLAWFLYETLERFGSLCEMNGMTEDGKRYRQQARELQTAIENSAWDGRWYLRAFYDNGTPLGSASNRECKIDSIAQSWSVISGAGHPQHARTAMDAVLEHLVYPDDRLILLFTPPFNHTPRDPGYIKGYVPGIRENGGQYTHAAIWVAWAFAMLGQGGRVGELYRLLNPIYQSDTRQSADVYKVEPYVIAADIYSTEPHVRRGGWTWYTGSSGWMYRLGIEALLGLKRTAYHLLINPTIPAEWDHFEIEYRHGRSSYQIFVSNPNHVEQGVVSVKLDGMEQANRQVMLVDDGKIHRVEVVMGLADSD